MNELQFYRFGNDIEQVVEVLSLGQTTEGAVRIVSWKSVIATALNVESHQVHTERFAGLLEQVVGQVFRNVVIKVLNGLSGQTDEEFVQIARSVDHLRLEEMVAEDDVVFFLALNVD